MVKVGDKWVTKEEQAQLQASAVERATAARLLLVQGRLKEAAAEIDSALAENPQNAAAHYLRGVAAVPPAAGRSTPARRSRPPQIHPNHGPTLNNIAVLMWGSKQFPGAINYYGQAMNAAPGTRAILDNVAEALNELPKTQRDNAATKKVVLLFNAQDMTLQGRMKKRGLFRWGSTWVTEKDAQAARGRGGARSRTSSTKMEDEFEQVQDRLEQIDRDIADTERSIRRIEASSYGRDAAAGRSG